MPQSPDIRNYYVGKGVISFKQTGEPTYRDLGNVPEFEFTPEIEELEHFSSREGVRQKDRTIVLEKSGTVRLVLEEWTLENLKLAVLGELDTDSEGDFLDIFASNAISGALRFVGTNEVGTKFQWDFNQVDFIPGSSVSPISDEWGQLEINGNLAAVDGKFGKLRVIGGEGIDSSS